MPYKMLTWGIFLLALLNSQIANAVVVLRYQHISEKTPADISTPPELFAAHLAYLAKAKFNIISMPELVSKLNNGETLPRHTVAITFDGGYRSIYEHAYPLLKKRGWPFTVFITTEDHEQDNRLYMTWKQLKKLSTKGGAIANGSSKGLHLIRRTQDESFRAWEKKRVNEIVSAEARIVKKLKLKREPKHKVFAYPFGEYDQKLQTLLKSMGYVAFGRQSGPIGDSSHLQALPRFSLNRFNSQPNDFAARVHSLPFPQARVKVLGKREALLTEPELPQGMATPRLRIASPVMPYVDNPQCFATSLGAIKAEIQGSALVVSTPRELPVGRSYYECAVDAGGGRLYWYAEMFLRRQSNGAWYEE